MHTHSEYVLVNCTDKCIHVSQSHAPVTRLAMLGITHPPPDTILAQVSPPIYLSSPLSSVRWVAIYIDRSHSGGFQTDMDWGQEN